MSKWRSPCPAKLPRLPHVRNACRVFYTFLTIPLCRRDVGCSLRRRGKREYMLCALCGFYLFSSVVHARSKTRNGTQSIPCILMFQCVLCFGTEAVSGIGTSANLSIVVILCKKLFIPTFTCVLISIYVPGSCKQQKSVFICALFKSNIPFTTYRDLTYFLKTLASHLQSRLKKTPPN